MDDSVPYQEEGIFVTGADVDRLARNSGYFSTIRNNRYRERSPPTGRLVNLPGHIQYPKETFSLFYCYTLGLPIRRSQTRIVFSDLVYLCGYLLVPQDVLRHIVTRYYILPSRSIEKFIDAFIHLASCLNFIEKIVC